VADLVWTRCRGINQFDSPLDVPEDAAADGRNMHRYEGALGSKRAGSTAQTLTGDTHSGYNALIKFLPGQDETAAELFIVSSDGTVKILRVAAGTAKSNLTLKDNVATRAWDVSSAVLNGKLYLAYDSTVNRMHVFDPALSTTVVRRSGHATPAAATVADTGAGAYAATLRYYRIQWRTKSGSTLQRSSLLGTAVSFTPSGTGTHARITQPTVPSEGESHWAIYGSADDISYYELAEVVIGTTTYDDNETPSDYDVNDPAPQEGFYTPFPSVKFIGTDGNRLYGLGVWETSAGDSVTPKAGRFFFTPVLDTSDADDDERISNTTTIEGWIDLSRNAGAVDRGVSPKPVNGVIYAFFSKGIYMLIPTESAVAPYRRVLLTGELGALTHASIVVGEDKAGKECLYFLDPEKGPYRIGRNGLEWVGKDVSGTWATLNPSATGQVAWGVYLKKFQWVLFGIATGASNDPDTILVFDVSEGESTIEDGVRYGWDIWTGDLAAARCAVIFAESMGASMGRTQTLYCGRNSDTKLLRYNTSTTSDDGTTFRGYQTSKAFVAEQVLREKSVLRSAVLATAESGVTLTQGLIRNFGDETTRTDTALLTAAGSETRVLKRFESPDLVGAYCFQVEIGDGSAAASGFTLERWGAVVKESDYKGN
jgi:hypothetical protein